MDVVIETAVVIEVSEVVVVDKDSTVLVTVLLIRLELVKVDVEEIVIVSKEVTVVEVSTTLGADVLVTKLVIVVLGVVVEHTVVGFCVVDARVCAVTVLVPMVKKDEQKLVASLAALHWETS